MSKWNPESYLKYTDERTQSSRDLVSRIDVANPVSTIDIGCGPGNSTMVLREKWPDAQITGLDSSKEMIDRARRDYPELCWVLADAMEWQTEDRFDIVFSNAVLHWIPNHEALIPKLFDLVKDGGALAVQVPANNGAPLHQAVLKISKTGIWKELMVGCDEALNYRDASFYYDQLSAISGRFYVWQTTYYHVMKSHQGLIDWNASTSMRPFLERLSSEDQRRRFQEQVLDECRSSYPQRQDGAILFPFNRVFFVAYKVE